MVVCARREAGILIARLRGQLLWLLCAALISTAASAAPKSELWPRWNLHDAQSARVLNHGAWQAFLDRYVVLGDDGITRVRYGEVTLKDKGLLRVYLDQLQRTPVSKLRRDEQRAYWINLYNAQTVKLVLDRYPLQSILDIQISPGFFAKGPWGAKLLKVEDETLSLDDIEHRILRPIWNDARTHYALNCASLGCPNLASQAFTAGNMDALLDAGARAYINHPRGARVERGDLIVSSIYDWFEADFGGNTAGVIAHLRAFAAPPLATNLQGISRIKDHAYDWSLNDLRVDSRTPDN